MVIKHFFSLLKLLFLIIILLFILLSDSNRDSKTVITGGLLELEAQFDSYNQNIKSAASEILRSACLLVPFYTVPVYTDFLKSHVSHQ